MSHILEHFLEVPYSGELRRIQVYLPKSYEKNKRKKFPVLYMHDGQNLFFNKDSYAGVSWGVKNTMEQFENTGEENAFIVVGIDNCPERMFEYSPCGFVDYQAQYSLEDDAVYADKYLDFVVENVKAFIDENYRTKKSRKFTWMAGSSAGANITLYAAYRYPEVFSKFGAFSTATWLFRRDYGRYWDNYHAKGHKFYFYVGGDEGYGGRTHGQVSQAYLNSTMRNVNALMDAGVSYKNIRVNIKYNAKHTEMAWRKSFPDFVRFLLEV